MMVQMKMILIFNKYRTMIIKVGELIFERFCHVRKPSDQHLKNGVFFLIAVIGLLVSIFSLSHSARKTLLYIRFGRLSLIIIRT